MAIDKDHHRPHVRLKQIPEDFIVTERPIYITSPDGEHQYFILRKRGLTTIGAIHAIARGLGIEAKRISFAGNKDKHAVTEQAISIHHIEPARVIGLRIPGVSIESIGRGDRPIRLGDLQSNAFAITIREIEQAPPPLSRYVNHYGSQRFGRHNAAIGRAIIKRRYIEAITMICESSADFAEPLHAFLGEHPNNPIGALRLLPKTLLMLYVHAYQSMLWNETVDAYLSAKGTGTEAPLIGFDLEIDDPIMNGILDEILTREGLSPRDFVFRDIPELCAEGGLRDIYVDVTDLAIGPLEQNELGPGKKITVRFSLPPGSYATIFIEQLFSQID